MQLSNGSDGMTLVYLFTSPWLVTIIITINIISTHGRVLRPQLHTPIYKTLDSRLPARGRPRGAGGRVRAANIYGLPRGVIIAAQKRNRSDLSVGF